MRLAAPMDAFSEAMLTDVGLPSRIVARLVHLFNMAVDEGILDAYSRAIPQDVLAADPNAAHAWSWRMGLLRQEVLGSLLASEVQRVEGKISDLRTFHRRKGRHSSAAAPPRDAGVTFADAGRGLRRSDGMYGSGKFAGAPDGAPIWFKPKRATQEQAVQCDLIDAADAAGGTHTRPRWRRVFPKLMRYLRKPAVRRADEVAGHTTADGGTRMVTKGAAIHAGTSRSSWRFSEHPGEVPSPGPAETERQTSRRFSDQI